jgi:hypothetical protein
MIQMAREAAHHLTTNIHEGRLSKLPREWTGRFRLVVSSLVLDWTALGSVGDSERLRVLSELIRVCDPHGLIWLTFNEKALDQKLFIAWIEALKNAGCELSPLTGFIVPEEEAKKEKPAFAFWSIVVTPAGHQIVLTDPLPLRFRFELGYVKYKHARGSFNPAGGSIESPILYDRFVIQDPDSRVQIKDDAVVRQILLGELTRWAKVEGKPIAVSQRVMNLFGSDWRALKRLQERGIISFN